MSSSEPQAYNMSTELLISLDEHQWESLWQEHLAFYTADNNNTKLDLRIEHGRLDRIRLERIIQAIRMWTKLDPQH